MRPPTGRDIAGFVRALRSPARRSAVRSVVDGAIVTVQLRRRGVRPLLTRLDASAVRSDPALAREISTAVDAGLGLLPMAPTCLRRSVTLVRELDRVGVAGAIHVGVRDVGGTIEAHAWVQSGDVVINDDPELVRSYIELGGGDLERHLRSLR